MSDVQRQAVERSAAQREAARRNGARSRGPVTEEGKARASGNAVKHGLFARRVARWAGTGEEREAVEAMIEGLTEEYEPQTVIEEMLIEELADERLRFRRAKEWQDVLLLTDEQAEAAKADPHLARLVEQRGKLPSLEVCLRQQNASWRRINRMIARLEECRKQRDRQQERERFEKLTAPPSVDEMLQVLGALERRAGSSASSPRAGTASAPGSFRTPVKPASEAVAGGRRVAAPPTHSLLGGLGA